MAKKNTANIIFRGVAFVLGTFLLALTYNLLLLPNNLVVGGMSGLSIVFQEVFGWDARAFIYISSLVLLLVSYIFLEKEKTYNTIVGSILYPIMISITSPIATFVLDKSDMNEMIVLVCLAGFLYGVSNGIIYKMGFTTGGGDVIMQLLNKYLKISSARANFIYSFIIILLSGCVFGISSLIYAIIILIISNTIIDKILVGISNSKVFFISTKKPNEIKDLIHLEFESGLTCIPTKSTLFHKKGELLMVVIPNREYYIFRGRVLEIDPEAFFIINDCYEVGGGKRHNNIPFM
jgi:uncharacterized membrane-anchored protein YitT (DUF2179 family)